MEKAEKATAMLESSFHSSSCAWYNFLKVKTPSVRVISKVQLQPGVWVHRGTSMHTNTHGLLMTSYLVRESGRAPRALQAGMYRLVF